MKPNIWEFVKNQDGRYSILHRGEVVRDGIPEQWFDEEVCARYGFCGEELQMIREVLKTGGKCTIRL